jgi:TldD protein
VAVEEIQVRLAAGEHRGRQDHPGLARRVGYDDEGVKCKRWDIIKDGILVNYQATRDQAHIIGEKESHGCSYADSWSNVQFQRMPNVSLAGGQEEAEPGRDGQGHQEGHLHRRRRFVLDRPAALQLPVWRPAVLRNQGRQDRPDAGRRGLPVEHPGILERLHGICDERDWRMGGSFFDGKGQPPQISIVSHGSSTARFNGINVINTARKIG